MQETQILSTRPALLPEAEPRGAALGRALVFDACHVGVVLRAVLGVEAVLGVGAMFAAPSPAEWLALLALLTAAALPATLAWLVVACSLKQLLEHLRPPLQYAAGVLPNHDDASATPVDVKRHRRSASRTRESSSE